MGLYNFQKRFVPYILEGSKTHTIRGRRQNPEKCGNTMHLYTGLRQKETQLLLRAPCVRIEEIEITAPDAVLINGVELTQDEFNLLAWRDGFREGVPESAAERMKLFWSDRLPFVGHIIHWDYARRQILAEREA